MTHPLMPKATAVWLLDNTSLTFDQIAEFCGLHTLEVQAIADGEVAPGMQGLNPIALGQLTQEDIDRCAQDQNARLRLALRTDVSVPSRGGKGGKYTPIAKRQDKPDGIAWILKHHPELTDTQIGRLLGTTKNTIHSIRSRSHWNIQNIKARHPVLLGLCQQSDLESAVNDAARFNQKRGEAMDFEDGDAEAV